MGEGLIDDRLKGGRNKGRIKGLLDIEEKEWKERKNERKKKKKKGVG